MSFSTTIKIIIGLAVLCLIFLVVWVVRTPSNALNTQDSSMTIPELDMSLLPEQQVRTVLSRASFNNPDTIWLATQMSEPTPVSEILQTEDAWQSAYIDFQTILNLDTASMDILWEDLIAQTSVGEWEAVIAAYINAQSGGNGLTLIQVPLVSYQSGQIGPFGCGAYITFSPFEIPETTGVLNAVYDNMFNQIPIEMGGDASDIQNITATQTGLTYDSVEIVNGAASLYLSGTIMTNSCADPAFRGQIEAAAFQFDTVESLTVFVNGQVFDWCSLDQSDGEGPCPEDPQIWMVNQGDAIYQ